MNNVVFFVLLIQNILLETKWFGPTWSVIKAPGKSVSYADSKSKFFALGGKISLGVRMETQCQSTKRKYWDTILMGGQFHKEISKFVFSKSWEK